MRLKSEIWVSAHIRLAVAQGAMATVISKGDGDAGAIYIQTLDGDGEAVLYGPAQPLPAEELGNRYWRFLLRHKASGFGAGEGKTPIEDYLARQRSFDPDIWVIEIEDLQGYHFLDEHLIEE